MSAADTDTDATEVADPRALLAKYGFAAKKSWGQNFLISTRVYDAIVRAAVRAPDAHVVEIGAGLGTLTARLAAAAPAGRVTAIEREREMAEVLRGELGSRENLEIVEGNALAFDYAAAAARAGRPLVVVGNLPYQIASRLVFHVLEARRHVERIVIMLQKEMADRLLAAPGTKQYGALGVMVRTYADARTVVKAPPGAFHPRPRVDSTVIELTPLAGGSTRAPIDDEARYSAVVHAAFGQRRKTLKNALRARWDDEAVTAALVASGIDGNRRGETLTIDEFARLTGALPGPRTS